MIKSKSKILLLEQEIERLKKLVYIDFLTQVYNRRGFLKIGDSFLRTHEEQKGKKYKKRKNTARYLSIILLDIDDFKKINDKYGHLKGDKVLKKIAQLLKNILRKTDIIGRWGGEEFVILLINTSYHQAKKVAEKLRSGISHKRIAGVNLTISAGLVRLTKEKRLTNLITKADKLMYLAKKRGKNQIVAL